MMSIGLTDMQNFVLEFKAVSENRKKVAIVNYTFAPPYVLQMC